MSLSVPTVLDHGNVNTASSFQTNSVTPSGSVVWIIFSSSPATDTQAVSGLGGSWARAYDSGGGGLYYDNEYLDVWIGTGCSGSGKLTVTRDSGTTYVQWIMLEWPGEHATTPYVATNTKTATGGSKTSLSVTPGALASSSNAYMVVVGHKASAEDTTPLNSATEVYDYGASVYGAAEINEIIGWTSGAMGGSWATSSSACVLGFEIAAAAAAATKAPVHRYITSNALQRASRW